MKILDEKLLAEASSNEAEPFERFTIDDKDFLDSLAKKAAEIESEPEMSK
jgi:hypothetical protein